MVGAIVFSMVAAVAVSTYVMMNRMWKEDVVLNMLSRDANIAIEKMVRGRPSNSGIIGAQSVESPLSGASGNSINYTDMNGVSRRFYYSSGSILSESGTAIATNVNAVTFYNIDNMIRIDLAMHKYVVSKEIRFSIETQVSPRN